MRNNILLFILVLSLSLAAAPYFGNWYNQFDHQQGSAFWGLNEEDSTSFAGFFLAYTFFIPLVFQLFGKENKNKWMIWSLVPVILFYAGYKWQILYIPISASIVGCLIAKLIRLIYRQFKHPLPPMVIKK